jgi:NIPSNAP
MSSTTPNFFRRPVVLKLIFAAVLAVMAISGMVAGLPAADSSSERFFEMRIYTAAEGKLDDLNKRFRNHTNKLFVKHGMTLIGYWTPTDGPKSKDTLIYILAYPSQEAREKSWKDFQNDPDWKTARDASEVNGKLVAKVESTFMKPTDYSPIK